MPDSRDTSGSSVTAKLTYVVDSDVKPINYPSEAGGRDEKDTGVDDIREVTIANARLSGEEFSLDQQGFELVSQDPPIDDFYDDERVSSVYAESLRQLLMQICSATDVVVFDHTRRTNDRQIRNERRVRDPAWKVHNDYTARSATQRVKDICGERASSLLARRFAIINVWRSTAGPIESSPIAVCDARSVSDSDLVTTERRARDRIGEILRIAFNPNHSWYYFPRIATNEALVIKTFDSATDGRAQFAPHAAFDDPGTADDAPPRESIDSRALVFY